jgi:hypothetical protein
MKQWLYLGLAVVLLAGSVGTTEAASISYMSTVVPQSELPVTATVELQQFDTALGTLTGISFQIVGEVTPTVTIVNFTSSPQGQGYVNAGSSTPVSISGPGVGFAYTASASVGAGTVPPANPMTGFSSVTLTASEQMSMSPLTPFYGDFTPYEGTGTGMISMDFDTGGNTVTGQAVNAGDLFFGGSALAGGYINVTYYYTPNVVPEPAAFSLLGIGVLGIFTYRRMFKSTRALVVASK